MEYWDIHYDKVLKAPFLRQQNQAEVRSLEVIHLQEDTRQLVAMYLESSLEKTPPSTILSVAQNIYKTPKIKEYLHKLKQEAIKNHRLDDFSQIQQLENEVVNLQYQELNKAYSGLDFVIKWANVLIEQFTLDDGMENKKYIYDERQPIEYISLWNNSYQVKFTVIRDSKSSLRWPQEVVLNFIYDGFDIRFFNDKNEDWKFNTNESWSKVDINRRWYEAKHRKWRKPFRKTVKLGKGSITTYWVKSIELDLGFL